MIKSFFFSSPACGRGGFSSERSELRKPGEGMPSPTALTPEDVSSVVLSRTRERQKFCAIVMLLFVFHPHLAFAKLNIVTTIKPVHSLVAAVAEGTDAKLTLLVDGNASEHTYALKPSQAKALSQADVVVYVGERLERFMEQPLATVPKNARILELSALPRLNLLPVRTGDAWVKHEHEDEHEAHEEHHHDEDGTDMHIWLDPNNAKLMVQAIANALAAEDAENSQRYQANAAALIQQIKETDRAIASELKPFANHKFIVMHDAYHYFEKRYGLYAAGSVMLRPDEPLAVKHLAEIRRSMKQGEIACLFSEPQFDDKALANLTKNTPTKQGVLDPLGAAIPAGPGHYLLLLKSITGAFTGCLGDSVK